MHRLAYDTTQVDAQYHALIRAVGLDAEAVFSRSDIKVWRKLADRENCTLDVAQPDDGSTVRLHIKRYPAAPSDARRGTPADEEVAGIRLLQAYGIPTVPLVGWGSVLDGRSFVLTLDLKGYQAGDKAVEAGTPFATLLGPTADLAADLHDRGLHHRDLYLCHFFARMDPDGGVTLALIDAARVRRLPRFLRTRWIVKDLAQFWYSTTKLPVTDGQRDEWLRRYAQRRGMSRIDGLRRAVERKARWIGRHDRKLNRQEPTRNISLNTP